MTRTALLCSASALMFCAAGTTLAAERARPATHLRGEVHRVIAAVPGAVTLYDQNSDDNGMPIISSNFTDEFDEFDSYGSDDFIVPPGHKWTIKQVEVTGTFSTAGDNGPAESEKVLFYKDSGGLPGKLVAKCDTIEGKDNQGSFAIKLPNSCKVKLKGGQKYWVSVVANINFSCCGEWEWETRNTENGNPAAWENPNGGFGSCRDWDAMTSCIGSYGEGPDFMFALKGEDIVKE
jgi:hypothetical protein